MALVDYGSSDDSGDEDVERNANPVQAVQALEKVEDVAEESDEGKLFSSLPKPRGQMILDGSEDKLKNLIQGGSNPGASKKEHVKILIPSLSDFESDESKPVTKKMKPSAKGVGLFSVLPPPKNATVKTPNRQFIPNVIKNQNAKRENMKVCANLENEDDDHDNEDPASNSYFGDGIADNRKLVESVSETDIQYGIPMSVEGSFAPPEYVAQNEYNHEPNFESESVSVVSCAVEDIPLPATNQTLELDEKALQILCGGKRKRSQMPMNIIDVSGEEIMPDSKEWLLKQLSQENRKTKSHSHRKHDGPSVQSRRKHQITYLAFQAKEQELELQNQWSLNRMSRKQTQSKYGF